MKLLLFSDLHRDTEAAKALVERSRSVDVAVAAGDLATVRRGLDGTVAALRGLACPVVLVAGNSETTAELEDTCRDWPGAHVLHGSGTEIDGVPFFGIGGGIPVTPFGSWSYDFTEEEAAELLRDCPTGCILVSHSPPKGAVDLDSSGRSLGSTAIRATIEEKRPLLVVCGHIHSSAGKSERIGETPVVNAGPGGVEWEVAAGR